MTERTHYEILGLTPDADGTTVNRTYWLLARKYQADAANDPRAHQMLDELNEAYRVLGTPPLREAYDAALPATEATPWFESESAEPEVPPATARRPRTPRRASRPIVGEKAAKLAPYAAAIAISAGALVSGIWSGNAALVVLGAGAAIAMVLVALRHKIAATLSEAAAGTAPIAPEREVRARALGWSRRHDQLEPEARPAVAYRGVQADELRESTASMVGRWRNAAIAASVETHESEHAPDSTLVDIFRSEHELETSAEPLSAVLEVLRGSRG